MGNLCCKRKVHPNENAQVDQNLSVSVPTNKTENYRNVDVLYQEYSNGKIESNLKLNGSLNSYYESLRKASEIEENAVATSSLINLEELSRLSFARPKTSVERTVAEFHNLKKIDQDTKNGFDPKFQKFNNEAGKLNESFVLADRNTSPDKTGDIHSENSEREVFGRMDKASVEKKKSLSRNDSGCDSCNYENRLDTLKNSEISDDYYTVPLANRQHDEIQQAQLIVENVLKNCQNIVENEIFDTEKTKQFGEIEMLAYAELVSKDDQQIESESLELTTNVDHVAYSLTPWLNSLNSLLSKNELVSYALSKSREDFETFNELKNFLTKSPARNTMETAWVIYLWVCHNIDHDIDDSSDFTVEDLFHSGKANNFGFSDLYAELCKNANVECISITGFVKDQDFNPFQDFKFTNHAWNAIQIDENRWELVDTAWGTGYGQLTLADQHVDNEFNPYYFLTPSDVFIFDHYSSFYQFQTNRFENLQSFISSPHLKSRYFIDGIKCLNYDIFNEYNRLLETSRNFKFKMDFSCAHDVSLAARLTDDNNDPIENTILVQKSFLDPNKKQQTYEINVSLKPDISSRLNVFSLKSTDDIVKSSWCASFYFEAVANEDVTWDGGLCRQFKFHPNIYLVKPLVCNLKSKQEHEFRLFIDRADVCDVVLIDSENNFFPFVRSQEDVCAWSLSHYCNIEGELNISVKLNEDSFYAKVLLFQIV